MKMKILRSLHARLIFILLSLSVYVWLAAAVLTTFDTRHELDDLLDSHLSLVASTLLAGVTASVPDHEVDAPSLHRMAPKIAFQVFINQSLAVHSMNAPHAPLSDVASGFSTVVLSDGAQWRVFGSNRNDGNMQVFVAEQLSARADILMSVLRSILWPIGIALPVLIGGSWWAVRIALSPFRRLREALAQRKSMRAGQIEFLDAPSEIGPLVDELNGLLSQLQDKIEHERQFTADVAHELRTPIAAIKINLDVLEAQLASSDANTNVVKALQRSMHRTIRLIDQLLELSRLDAEQDGQISWDTDLIATVEDVAVELTPRTREWSQNLAFDRPENEEGFVVKGRPELLASLIRNLVDNASKYACKEATIRLEVGRIGGHVFVVVEDSGPGLSLAEQARLGTRFFRGARNPAIGSGLGWSIISKIARQTQGRINLSTSPNLGGLRVEVYWDSSSEQQRV